MPSPDSLVLSILRNYGRPGCEFRLRDAGNQRSGVGGRRLGRSVGLGLADVMSFGGRARDVPCCGCARGPESAEVMAVSRRSWGRTRRICTVLSTKSAQAWFPLRGSPKTVAVTWTLESRCWRMKTASITAMAAPGVGHNNEGIRSEMHCACDESKGGAPRLWPWSSTLFTPLDCSAAVTLPRIWFAVLANALEKPAWVLMEAKWHTELAQG